MFARYGNSPHRIDDAYALGEAGGGSAGGGSVGLAVGRTQVLGVGGTYTFNPTTVLDANFGWTHQKLGAEAPDIDVNVGSDPDKMNIPGTNGPDRMQGGLPSFQISGWSNLGNDDTGNPFQFDDNQYSASLNLQKVFGGHVFRLGGEYLNQQINHFQPQGGAFQTVRGTFVFNGQSTMLQGASAPADARFNSWAAFLLGTALGRQQRRQGRTAPQPELDLHGRPGRPTSRTPGRSRTTSPSRSDCAGSSTRSRPARRQGRLPLRPLGRIRLRRWLRRRAPGHLRQLRQRPAPAAGRASSIA